MKIVLFHGYKGSPEGLWIPSVAAELTERGHTVLAPFLPNPQVPRLREWLPFVQESIEFTEDTVLIGHSSGGSLILALLEQIQLPVRQAILVAAFHEPLERNVHYPILKQSYDWEKIRRGSKEFIFIHSDNDPWGTGVDVGRSLVEKLGGRLVVAEGQGHFGSNQFNESYPEFPLLISLVAEQ